MLPQITVLCAMVYATVLMHSLKISMESIANHYIVGLFMFCFHHVFEFGNSF